MPIDYSKIPTADLEAMQTGDIGKVSTKTLTYLQQEGTRDAVPEKKLSPTAQLGADMAAADKSIRIQNAPVGRAIAETVGMVGGSMLTGGPLTPTGIAGAGLGYAMGRKLADISEQGLGLRTPADLLTEAAGTAKDAVTGMFYDVAGPAVVGAVKGAYNLGKNMVANTLGRKVPAISGEAVAERAGEVLGETRGKAPEYIRNAAEAAKLEEMIPGFKATMGEARNDPGLIKLQRSIEKAPGTGADLMKQRQASNNKAIQDYLDKEFSSGKSIDDVIEAFQGQKIKIDQFLQDAIVKSRAAMRGVKPVDAQTAGRNIVEAVEGQRIPAKRRVGAMYEQLPNEPVAPKNLKSAVDELEAGFRSGDEDVYPLRAIARVKEAINPPKDVVAPRGAFNGVAAEINEGLPVNQALATIKESGGISLSSLQQKYSQTQITELVKRRPGMVSKNGGANLEEIAADHGFGSGDELLSSILDAKPKSELAKKLTQQAELLISEGIKNDKGVPGFQDLHSLRKDIGRQAYDAMTGAKPNRELAMKLNRLKAAIDADIEAGMGASSDYVTAREAYADYANRFRRGSVEQILRRGNQASGLNLPDEGIPAKVFTPGGADQLISAVGKQNARALVEGYAANDLVRKATNPTTGEIRGDALNAWLRDNKPVLDKFGLTADFQNVAAAQSTVEAANVIATQFNKSLASKMLNADAGRAIEAAMTGAEGVSARNTGEIMLRLVKQLNGNKEAVDGLKTAFKDFIIKKVEVAVRDADISGFKGSANQKLWNELKKYEPAMKVIYKDEPKKLAALRNVQQAVQTQARSAVSPTGGGSDTVEVATNVPMAVIGNAISHTVGKTGLAMTIARRGLDAFNKMGEKDLNAVLYRALSDPELAETLMMAKNMAKPQVVENRLAGQLATMGIYMAGKPFQQN